MSAEKISALLGQMERVIYGKERQCRFAVAALLAGGHLLVEDVPGVGKTTLALTLARSLDLSFGRIQFTPDTLPGDVTGYATADLRTGELHFHAGPVMNHIVLADEINRTSPKTQASLLEVMEERQVTAEGRTLPVPEPFMVIATENPIEFAGTYHLPEAQLDRFLMRISMGYPAQKEELAMLSARLAGRGVAELSPVLSREELLAAQRETANVTVNEAIGKYIVGIADETRRSHSLTLGASPRAVLALARASQAWAYLDGRAYVVPEDVQEVAPAVLSHRLVVSLDASLRKITAGEILAECIRRMPVPPVFSAKS